MTCQKALCLLLSLALCVLLAPAALAAEATETDLTGDDALSLSDALLPDLRAFQWAYTNETAMRSVAMGGAAPAAGVNVPGFAEGVSNMERPVTVAVFDSLVDYTHPDLAGVVYHFSPAEQRALGCGEWGYNAVRASSQRPADFIVDAHATHCAGIIGAKWDGRGISGAASKARIVSVQVFDLETMETSIDSVLRGYDFVDRFNRACSDPADRIRVVSCSFSLIGTSLAVDAAVRAVGERWGTVSFFTAGNERENRDAAPAFASSLWQNPYAIVVAATDSAGQRASFTGYGGVTVGLGAPGVGILSTVSGDESAYLADACPALFYEGFEGAVSSVTVAQLGTEWGDTRRIVPAVSVTSGNEPRFAGAHALRVPVDPSLRGSAYGRRGGVYRFEITADFDPLLLPDDAQLGLSVGGSGRELSIDALETLGGASLERTRCDDSSCGGWAVSAFRLTDDAFSDGKLSVIATVIADPAAEDPALYFDSIGVGTDNVPYAFYDGTSMACPLAAGCAAVLAAAHPEDSGAQLAARVRAAVRPEATLRGFASTGGALDLTRAEQTADAFPTIAANDGRALFEDELPLDTATGDDPFALEESAAGDREAAGLLLSLGGRLWSAQGISYNRLHRSPAFVYHSWRAFDPALGLWAEETEMPVWLGEITACTYDGKLWMLGGLCGSSGGLPVVRDNDHAALYSYDPQTDEWKRHETPGPLFDWENCMLYAADRLYVLASERVSYGYDTNVYVLDPVRGACKLLRRNRDTFFPNPRIAVHNGVAYLADSACPDMLYRIDEDGWIDECDAAMPGFARSVVSEGADRIVGNTVSTAHFALTAGDEALYLVGLTVAGQTNDTWVLPDGEAAFRPMTAHLAASKPFETAAACLGGRLYAMAGAWREEKLRVFRATQITGE